MPEILNPDRIDGADRVFDILALGHEARIIVGAGQDGAGFFHGRKILVGINLPAVAARERRIQTAVEDIGVGFADGVVAGVKIERRLAQRANPDRRRQLPVQRPRQPVHRDDRAARSQETRGEADGMDSGVGTAGADQVNGVTAEKFGQFFLQHPLDRGGVGLDLPAAVFAAVVADFEQHPADRLVAGGLQRPSGAEFEFDRFGGGRGEFIHGIKTPGQGVDELCHKACGRFAPQPARIARPPAGSGADPSGDRAS
ncbi:hypothetical protein SDC9_113202 [bioreactor metagenome]|uniref:Uncharacterized protein n=1 Tax=bioreactor metagenome TaxID=1076179 RepID=A0A645BM06_9ZZZZ